MALKTLAALRWCTFRRFFTAQSPRFWMGIVLAFVVIALVLLSAGENFAPSLMESSGGRAPSVRSRDVQGRPALEVAFWIAALLSSVVSFRVMESLFRRPDIRALQALPLPAYAIFWERVITTAVESLGIGLLASIFFIPLTLKAPLAGGLAMTLLSIGVLSSGLLTLGAVTWVGAQFGSPDGPKLPGDAYGSTGGGFLYAPAAALALAMTGLVMFQLTLGEVLLRGTLSRAFFVGLGIMGLMNLASLLVAWRVFGGYHRIAAWFNEADSTGFSVSVEHQKSSFLAAIWEKWVPDYTRLVVRRAHVQGSRVTTAGRWITAAGLVITLVISMFASLPEWVLMSVPAILFAITNPWRRMWTDDVGPFHGQNLPVFANAEIWGRQVMVVLEWIRLVLPYGLVLTLVSLFHPGNVAVGAVSVMGVAWLMAGMLALDRFGPILSVSRFAPAYLTLLWVVLAAWSFALAGVVGGLSFIVFVVLLPRNSGGALRVVERKGT